MEHVLVKLAALIRRGDVFDARPIGHIYQKEAAVEYYLLRRACHVGYECSKLRSHIDFLKQTTRPRDIILAEQNLKRLNYVTVFFLLKPYPYHGKEEAERGDRAKTKKRVVGTLFS